MPIAKFKIRPGYREWTYEILCTMVMDSSEWFEEKQDLINKENSHDL